MARLGRRDSLVSVTAFWLCSIFAGLLLPITCALVRLLGAYMLPYFRSIPDISFYRDVNVPLTLRQAMLAAIAAAILLFLILRYVALFICSARGDFILSHGGEVTLAAAVRDYFFSRGLADAIGLTVLLVLSITAFFLSERRSIIYDLFTCPCTLYEGFGAPLGAALFVFIFSISWFCAVINALAKVRCKCFSAML